MTVVEEHITVAKNAAPETNLLVITSYLRPKDSTYLRYYVKTSGRCLDYRDTGYAIQASNRKQLEAQELQALQGAFRQVPDGCVYPPYERLLIMSYRDGTNWTTRTFDRARLPLAFGKIYEVIGERFETKRERE